MRNKVRFFQQIIKWRRELFRGALGQMSLLENPSAFPSLASLTEEEEQRIVELVHMAADFQGPIIEFGTLFGFTARRIAAEKRSDQKLITIDCFVWNPFGLSKDLHQEFTRLALRNEISRGNVVLYAGTSEAFRSQYKGAVPAMVFLDADHTYESVRDEIGWAKKTGIPIICGHDYGDGRFGVTRAVDEAFPEGVETYGRIWVKK